MTRRQTHTFAELELSQPAYDEIRAKLEAAGYQHAFLDGGAIDMHGIGVTRSGWAGAVHGHASDNDDVDVPELPAHVAALQQRGAS